MKPAFLVTIIGWVGGGHNGVRLITVNVRPNGIQVLGGMDLSLPRNGIHAKNQKAWWTLRVKTLLPFKTLV